MGDHIRKKRLDAKLLQKNVAGILGVDTMTVNNWERNRCQPRLYLFPKIAQFLGYSPFPVTEEPFIFESIKAYRIKHGVSQRKMAKVLGIDPTTLARWERLEQTRNNVEKTVGWVIGQLWEVLLVRFWSIY